MRSAVRGWPNEEGSASKWQTFEEHLVTELLLHSCSSFVLPTLSKPGSNLSFHGGHLQRDLVKKYEVPLRRRGGLKRHWPE